MMPQLPSKVETRLSRLLEPVLAEVVATARGVSDSLDAMDDGTPQATSRRSGLIPSL